MGKISYEDKARIEILLELGFWIPNNCCEISGKGLEALLGESKRVDERWSATERKPGRPSGQPKTARTEKNVRHLKLLISENLTLTLMLRHFTKY